MADAKPTSVKMTAWIHQYLGTWEWGESGGTETGGGTYQYGGARRRSNHCESFNGIKALEKQIVYHAKYLMNGLML